MYDKNFDYREKYIKDLQKENASLRLQLQEANRQKKEIVKVAKYFIEQYFKMLINGWGCDTKDWFRNLHDEDL
jgi:hypothetical protein